MGGAEVSQWLDGLGLADLQPLFERHGIDAAVLPLLQDEHLKEMGLPLGTRLKLLAALPGARTGADAAEVVERRHLSVLFVDLVGSTPLSTRMDPEALRDLLHAFHGTVNAEVLRLRGYVAQYKGDGALVYFGYPQAHEDDPQRAVMAALAIVRALAALRERTGLPVAAHLGIATGLAIVGDTFGQAAARERSAIGETPNLAARLSDLAGSGEIVVSAQTARLAAHQFHFEPLPPQTVKGIDRPVQAFRVVGERDSDSLFDARRGPVRGAMVGREPEMAWLWQRWLAAEQGRGQVVVISGEAGIGKSRLLKALDEALAARPHTRMLNQCSPHQSQTALHPLRRQIAQAAGLRPEDAPGTRFERLRTLLDGASAHELQLAAALLDLPAPGPAVTGSMTPAELRQRTFDLLQEQLVRAAGRGPVLWLLEDAHWIDPSTQELLLQCLPRIASLPVLAVVTCRPESALELPPAGHVHRIHLGRLGVASVRQMVRSLAVTEAVDDEVAARIAIRTDGVPLFVEELYRSLVEDGVLVQRNGRLEAHAAIDDLVIPASLHDSLMARLDHHRAHKELAQVASVIGREFGIDLLARVSGMAEPLLEQALRGLEDAEIVNAASVGPPRQYAFKHALVRDAAYESMLVRRREELHGTVLEALGSLPGVSAELMARHAAAAARPEQAIELWTRAAREALARAEFGEAVAHLRQALELNERCGAGEALLQQRLDLLLALGQATIPLRGYSHGETLAVFERANRLAAAVDDEQRSFWAGYASWVVHYVRGEHLVAHGIACDMLARAEATGSPGRAVAAIRSKGISEMILGQPAAARGLFDQAEASAVELRGRPGEKRIAVAQRFAADPEIATQFHVALTHWALGHLDAAAAISSQAVADARAMNHVHTLGHALVHGAIVAVVDLDPSAALPLCAEATDFATHHGMALWLGYAQILRGHALVLAGRHEPAGEALVSGLARMRAMGTGTMIPLHHAVCAWSLAAAGRGDEARAHAAHVEAELRHGCERYFWPDMLIWRARHLALTPGGADAEVEAALRQAVDEADAQAAPALFLKAATALGEQLLAQGRIAEADTLVAEAMGRMPLRSQRPVWRQALALARSIRARRDR